MSTTISGVLRNVLSGQVRATFCSEHASPFAEYLQSATWQDLRRSFPRQWHRIARSSDKRLEGRRLANDSEAIGWLREDLVVLAGEKQMLLPSTVLGQSQADKARSHVGYGLARRHGAKVARAGLIGIRSWNIHQLKHQFDGLDTATALTAVGGGTAAAAGYEGLTRTPGFEEFADGLLAQMANSASSAAHVMTPPANLTQSVPETGGGVGVDDGDGIIDTLVEGGKSVLSWIGDLLSNL